MGTNGTSSAENLGTLVHRAWEQILEIDDDITTRGRAAEEHIRQLGNTANAIATIDMRGAVIHGMLNRLLEAQSSKGARNIVDSQRDALRAMLNEERWKQLKALEIEPAPKK